MVEEKDPGLDNVFHALADGTRRAILSRVLNAPSTVGDLAEPFKMSLAAVSKHVVVLEHAGLVNRWRKGRQIFVTARPDELRPAMDLLEYYSTFWQRSLDSLEEFLLREGALPTDSHASPSADAPEASSHKGRLVAPQDKDANKKGSRPGNQSPPYSPHSKKNSQKKRRKGK